MTSRSIARPDGIDLAPRNGAAKDGVTVAS
jgi:hypothetical protein